ncbi:hypothetical protein TBLA_0D04630 [Henningerozyma blattae CBS 6284]|uniref:Ubiquitin-like protease family profile domain-containing protein n=1 Tax=Henningerozyma blattae (strain ATCC 34711 / CBS 6284 / DSM 70876 / NBRC 10599 / NRRL Y-10934 / UCD 77-7) TaxID=1071380 RepID=I2H3K7_HENB6|nr:hypothetical protein TBLA_0D04630 [Tetrapisispora blattae CBS 6284]CCH60959.1 hypothetical protein TBLA_0D04630 [Tetrapisispora blattae CBS 6284]
MGVRRPTIPGILPIDNLTSNNNNNNTNNNSENTISNSKKRRHRVSNNYNTNTRSTKRYKQRRDKSVPNKMPELTKNILLTSSLDDIQEIKHSNRDSRRNIGNNNNGLLFSSPKADSKSNDNEILTITKEEETDQRDSSTNPILIDSNPVTQTSNTHNLIENTNKNSHNHSRQKVLHFHGRLRFVIARNSVTEKLNLKMTFKFSVEGFSAKLKFVNLPSSDKSSNNDTYEIKNSSINLFVDIRKLIFDKDWKSLGIILKKPRIVDSRSSDTSNKKPIKNFLWIADTNITSDLTKLANQSHSATLKDLYNSLKNNPHSDSIVMEIVQKRSDISNFMYRYEVQSTTMSDFIDLKEEKNIKPTPPSENSTKTLTNFTVTKQIKQLKPVSSLSTSIGTKKSHFWEKNNFSSLRSSSSHNNSNQSNFSTNLKVNSRPISNGLSNYTATRIAKPTSQLLSEELSSNAVATSHSIKPSAFYSKSTDPNDTEATKDYLFNGNYQYSNEASNHRAPNSTKVDCQSSLDSRHTRSTTSSIGNRKIHRSNDSTHNDEAVYETPVPFKPRLNYKFSDNTSYTITNQDFKCLYNNDWINDTIIDFFIKYYVDQSIQNNIIKKDEISIMTSFFYTKLISTKENYYENVKKWVNNSNLFDKKYIIIPINMKYHWYCSIIINMKEINQYLKRKKSIHDFQMSKGHTNEYLKKATPDDDNTTGAELKLESEIPDNNKPNVTNLQNKDKKGIEDLISEVGNDSALINLSTSESLEQTTSHKLSASPEQAISNDSENLELRRESQNITDNTEINTEINTELSTDINNLDLDMPPICILTFDSLRQTHTKDIEPIKEFLISYAKDKYGFSISKFNIRMKTCQVPLQPNFSDCGVHVILNIMKFCQDPSSTINFWYSIKSKNRSSSKLVNQYFDKRKRSIARLTLRDVLWDLQHKQIIGMKENNEQAPESDDSENNEEDIEIIEEVSINKHNTENKKAKLTEHSTSNKQMTEQKDKKAISAPDNSNLPNINQKLLISDIPAALLGKNNDKDKISDTGKPGVLLNNLVTTVDIKYDENNNRLSNEEKSKSVGNFPKEDRRLDHQDNLSDHSESGENIKWSTPSPKSTQSLSLKEKFQYTKVDANIRINDEIVSNSKSHFTDKLNTYTGRKGDADLTIISDNDFHSDSKNCDSQLDIDSSLSEVELQPSDETLSNLDTHLNDHNLPSDVEDKEVISIEDNNLSVDQASNTLPKLYNSKRRYLDSSPRASPATSQIVTIKSKTGQNSPYFSTEYLKTRQKQIESFEKLKPSFDEAKRYLDKINTHSSPISSKNNTQFFVNQKLEPQFSLNHEPITFALNRSHSNSPDENLPKDPHIQINVVDLSSPLRPDSPIEKFRDNETHTTKINNYDQHLNNRIQKNFESSSNSSHTRKFTTTNYHDKEHIQGEPTVRFKADTSASSPDNTLSSSPNLDEDQNNLVTQPSNTESPEGNTPTYSFPNNNEIVNIDDPIEIIDPSE